VLGVLTADEKGLCLLGMSFYFFAYFYLGEKSCPSYFVD